MRIHAISIGQPRTVTDAQGAWASAIFREPVDGPVALGERGLAGDRVADTRHHGAPDQAVCCHPLAHFALWNAELGLTGPAKSLGPGSVGENWTLSGGTEADVCVGDVYAVGSARVRVSGPRYPCWKQDRKLGLPGFHRRSMETLRTGFYVAVAAPGVVKAGDAWTLEERPNPHVTVHEVNATVHRKPDAAFARRALEAEGLPSFWRALLERVLSGET
ncbi:MAG: MOSC domain-containing protein [Chthonomonadales bacterium]|nr:MOSC domain-containing protein [Chthonomonadales bacterium]